MKIQEIFKNNDSDSDDFKNDLGLFKHLFSFHRYVYKKTGRTSWSAVYNALGKYHYSKLYQTKNRRIIVRVYDYGIETKDVVDILSDNKLTILIKVINTPTGVVVDRRI